MLTSNAPEFALQLERKKKQTEEQFAKLLIKVGLELGELLVRHSPGAPVPGTPRDTGYAAQGWYATLNQKGTGDQRGGDPQAALGAWGKAKLGDTLYWNNGVVYIFRLENGWSQQAPVGMVEPAVAFLKQKYSSGSVKQGTANIPDPPGGAEP